MRTQDRIEEENSYAHVWTDYDHLWIEYAHPRTEVELTKLLEGGE